MTATIRRRGRRARDPFVVGTNRHGTPIIDCRWHEHGRRRTKQFPVIDGVDPTLIIAALKAATEEGDVGWREAGWDIKPWFARVIGAALPIQSSESSAVEIDPEPGSGARRVRRLEDGPTVDEFAPLYLEFVRNEDNSERTVSGSIESEVKALCHFLGARKLISFRAMRGLRTSLNRFLPVRRSIVTPGGEKKTVWMTPPGEVSPTTIVNRIRRLRDMCRVAYIEGEFGNRRPELLDDRLPKKLRAQANEARREKKPLSASELRKLLAILRAPESRADRVFYAAIEVCLLTGLRFGEVVAFRYEDTPRLDQKGVWEGTLRKPGSLYISCAWNKHGNWLGPTKNKRKWSIPVTPRIEVILNEMRLMHQGKGPYVFSNRGGATPASYSKIRARLLSVFDEAGVPWRPFLAQKIFRKTYITAGGVCGVPLKYMQAQYGHATVEMVQDEYDLHVDTDEWPTEDEIAFYRDLYGFDLLIRKARAV